MKKTEVLELLKEFKGVGEVHKIISLIERDYIPVDCDIYVVYSKSIINGWTSPKENNKYYRFYVELVKEVEGKTLSALVNIEHYDVDLLMKLYRTLMLFKLKWLY